MTGRNFIPFPLLKTGRLVLRQLLASDDTEIFALRSNETVNKYLGRKPCNSIEDAQAFIQVIDNNVQSNKAVYWAITLTGSDKLIGTICLFDFSDDHLKAEIGYELLPHFQGKGIMEEAVLKVIDFGKQELELHSIEAHTHAENQSSTRLLEKIGFKKEATVEDNLILYVRLLA